MFAFQSSAENSTVVCEDLDGAFAQLAQRTRDAGLDEIELRWTPAGIDSVRMSAEDTVFTMSRMPESAR